MTAPRRRLRGKLSRLTFRLLLFVLIVLSAALILYANRVHLINQTLAYLIAPFRVQVGEIDFLPFGHVRISNLTLTPKDASDESPLAWISETRITYRLSELRATHRFDDLLLFGAHVRLNQKNLDTLLSSNSDEADDERHPQNASPITDTTEPFLLSRLAIFTGTVSAENGQIQIALEALPQLEAQWDFHCERFDLDHVEPTTLSLTLRDLLVGENASSGRIAVLSGKVTLAPDLSQVDVHPLLIRSPELHITPELFKRSEHPDSQTRKARQGQVVNSTLSDHATTDPQILLRGIKIEDARIALAGFDGKNSLPRLPDFGFAISTTLPEARFQNGQIKGNQPLSLDFTSVRAGSGKSDFLTSEKVELRLNSLSDFISRKKIAELKIDRPILLASDDSLDRLLPSAESEKNTASPTPSEPWVIQSLEIDSASLRGEKLTLSSSTPLPEFKATLDAKLHDLRFGGAEGFDSDGQQTLSIRQLQINAPRAKTDATPLLCLSHAETSLDWNILKSEHRVDRISLKGPNITLTDETLGSWADSLTEIIATPPSPSESKLDHTTPVPSSQIPVYAVTDLSITDGKVLIDTSAANRTIPRIEANLLLTTRTGSHAESAPDASKQPADRDSAGRSDTYRLALSDLNIQTRAPDHPHPSQATSSEDEILSVKSLYADISARDIQLNKHIGVVHIDGALLTVGDGLKSTFGPQLSPVKSITEPVSTKPVSLPSPSPPSSIDKAKLNSTKEPDKPSATALETSRFPVNSTKSSESSSPSPSTNLPGGWSIGEIEISRSAVHFKSLIPQVEGLQFAIETKLRDIPLTLKGLLAQSTLQKVELTGIEIKDPYDSFITVAELPTIFVEFSLAGLARQEIERIQLIGPSLWVGQGLFWWIDYQRNFREQNEGARVRFEDTPEKKTDWAIKTLEASSGKIVIAPAGVPIGAVPFPFNATTSMREGDIELKLSIPDEDHIYRFPDYKVEVQGLVGDVQFNVPVKTEDNNLVQTFTLRRARWKEYEAKDLYLSVTFDENGVYGHFGGAAYKGYVDGQFNFYLNGQDKWDAWIAGSDLDTGPITSILVPDSFLMNGRVSLKLVSDGSGTLIGKTTGDFHTTTPGWFDITKLDPVLKELPPEWTMLQRGLTEMGLNAIKQFNYDQGVGKVDFQNREGTLALQFTGPYGQRQLNIAVHDDAAQSQPSSRKTAPIAAVTTSPESLRKTGSHETDASTLSPKRRNRFTLFRRKARP